MPGKKQQLLLLDVMKHVVVRAPGGYGQLKIERAAIQKPLLDEVVVKTTAIGVNYADVCVRMGLYSSAQKVYHYEHMCDI